MTGAALFVLIAMGNCRIQSLIPPCGYRDSGITAIRLLDFDDFDGFRFGGSGLPDSCFVEAVFRSGDFVEIDAPDTAKYTSSLQEGVYTHILETFIGDLSAPFAAALHLATKRRYLVLFRVKSGQYFAFGYDAGADIGYTNQTAEGLGAAVTITAVSVYPLFEVSGAGFIPPGWLRITPSLSFTAGGDSRTLSIDCNAGRTWVLSGLPAGWSASAISGIGPAEITITAPNNTSTQAVAGTITVTGADKTATCTLSQAAGAKVYGDVVIGTYSYGVIPAGGGAVSPSLTYAQEWTWNGVGGSGGRLGSGAAVSYSGSGIDASTGAVSAASKGTTVSGQTTVTTATVAVTMNGKSATTSATVYQAANTKTLTGLAIEKYRPDAAWQSPDHWNDIGAHGGNFLAVLGYMDYVFSSEATSRELYSSSHYKSILGQDDGLTLDPSATSWVEYYPPGGLRIKERGTTVGGARKGSVSWTYEGMTSNAIGFTQEANVVVGIAYATPMVSLAVADIPAGGGSVASGEVTYSQAYQISYSSGAMEVPALLTSGGTVSYSPAVSAGSLGTTVKARTSVGNLNVTVTMNGKVGVGSATVYQAANVWIGYSDFTVQSVTYNEIPYIGGTVNPYVLATYLDYYSSGASEAGKLGLPPGMVLRCTMNAPGFSVTLNGEVTAEINTSGNSRSATVYMDFVEDNILRDHKAVTVTQKGE